MFIAKGFANLFFKCKFRINKRAGGRMSVTCVEPASEFLGDLRRGADGASSIIG